jgi:hypothetical protein
MGRYVGADPIDDYRPVLADAGFAIEMMKRLTPGRAGWEKPMNRSSPIEPSSPRR